MSESIEEMMKNALAASESDDEVVKEVASTPTNETQKTKNTFHEDDSPQSNTQVKKDSYATVKTETNGSGQDSEGESEEEQTHEQIHTEEQTAEQPQNTDEDNTAQFIAKILVMSDIYHGFDDDTNSLISKLFETKDESKILALSLNQDLILTDAFKSLGNVHKASEVDKAFYLVSLPDNILNKIGDLVRIFMGKDIKNTDHIKYCRELEAQLRTMDDKFISRTNSILKLLQAGQKKE